MRQADENLQDLRDKGFREAEPSAMRGFEPRFKDIVDYIVRITHRIWEEGDMGYIYDTYGHNCTVHTAYGVSYGIEAVVSGSIAFLAGFPDRRLYAEDVIWTGDDQQGFHSSHLIMNTATNSGYSAWGPPTAKPVRFWAIANCFVKENRITEEWLVRDTAAIVRQLGFDIWQVAREMKASAEALAFGETDRLEGQLPPAPLEPDQLTEIEAFVRKLFHDLWNGRHFNRLTETHHHNVMMWLPNHAAIHGINAIKAYVLGLIAMFPDAHMSVEHVYWLGDEATGYRVAVRWRLTGTHQHYGFYGKASGRRINVLGISHLHIKQLQITKHYFVFDELALMMQLVS